MAIGKKGLPCFAICKWYCLFLHYVLRFLCGLVDKIAGFHPVSQGSIPLEDFYTFWQYLENFQTLRACHAHIGSFLKCIIPWPIQGYLIEHCSIARVGVRWHHPLENCVWISMVLLWKDGLNWGRGSNPRLT